MNGRLLIVEDDDSLNRAISRRPFKESHAVYSAATIKEASRLCHEHRISFIICDIPIDEKEPVPAP